MYKEYYADTAGKIAELFASPLYQSAADHQIAVV